ncbi:MAG TPA: F0F1 ATP synthase subunit delta [Candidatus Paceibacterota bacterium]|nr:F0F1 ATP synthase subunit delta [Candidatus Paceibacterota bacterium]
MRYSAHIYAKALAEVIADSPKLTPEQSSRIAKNFLALVRRNGDEAHLTNIVEHAARLARGASGVRKVTVAAARRLTPAQEKELARFLTPTDVVERITDPQLIAGVRITVNDELQFDASLKGKLDTIFNTH